jgi:hypothetical protein
MLPKHQSAFDQALIESQQKTTPLSPSVDEVEVEIGKEDQHLPHQALPTAEFTDVESNALKEPVSSPVTATSTKKIGRPKGIAKTKKTFYLTNGAVNLKAAQIALVKKAGLFIRDESDVADLALALLNSMLEEDEQSLKKILEIYNG